MARSRTKMVKIFGDHLPPESEVGKVDINPGNSGAPKRSAKAHPLEKPSVKEIDGSGAIENLNLASTGELIQRLEKELKVNGPHTEAARRLKAALGKAFDAEPSGMKSKEELELIMRAAASRWPIMPDARRKLVSKTVEDAEHDDPNVRSRAARNLIAMDRLNQSDEHHEEGETINHVVETAEQRRLRLSAISNKLGANGVVIDVASRPAINGHPAINGTSHANGTSNGKPH